MSFNVFRKGTSSKQNERIKVLLQRLEKFESEANPVENNNLFALGFTSRSFITYHNNLSFVRLHVVDENDYKAPVEPDGKDFVLWWTFDGLTELEDKSFFGHSGEVNGALGCGVLAEGVNEGIGAGGSICMRFDGSSKYIKTYSSSETSTIGELGITDKTAWSLFVRFKVDNPSTNQVLIEKNDDLDVDYAYRVAITGNRIIFVVRHAGESIVNATPTISPDTWYDVWFIYNSGVVTIYINGSVVGTTDGEGSFNKLSVDGNSFDTGADLAGFQHITTASVGTAFLVGVDAQLQQYFKGYVQDVRFWKRVITSTEVGNMWVNKVSISNIPFERVGVVGFSAVALAKRKTIQESIQFNDVLTPLYKPTNPKIRMLNESLVFDDDFDVIKNPTIPINIDSDNITFDDFITLSRGSLQTKVGNITKSTQTSGLPFSNTYSEEVGFPPKFMIFWGSLVEAYDDFTSRSRFFMGFTDGTNNVGLCFSSDDDSSDQDSAKGLYDSCIVHVDDDTGVEALAKCSFLDNGFKLTYTNNNNLKLIINYVALGGSKLTHAKVGTFAQPTSATGTHTVSGIGFVPNFISFMPTQFTSINSNNESSAFWFGATDLTRQFSLAITDQDDADPTVTRRISRNDRAITLLGANPTGYNTVMKSAIFSDVTEDGFILDYDVNGATGSVAGLCAYAALRGVKCVIGKFTPSLNTGIEVINDPNLDFKPSLILFMGHGKVVENSNTPSTEALLSFGAGIDSLNRRSTTLHSKNNEDSSLSVHYARSGRIFNIIDPARDSDDSGSLFSMDLVSVQQGGFTVTKSSVNTNIPHDIHYIAFG